MAEARVGSAAATVGDYAIFAGGIGPDPPPGEYIGYFCTWDLVEAYDTALTKSTPTPLSVARHNLAGATVGDFALFAGGHKYENPDNIYRATVDAYDTALTRTTPDELSQARSYLAAATVGNYGIFGGGYGGSGYSAAVDAYDIFLTRISGLALSQARSNLGAAALIGNLPPGTKSKDFAVFVGGYVPDTHFSSGAVDAYDESLRMTSLSFYDGAYNTTGASVGNYALFAGGIVYEPDYANLTGYTYRIQTYRVNKKSITGG
jgi:hypothetical protein